MDVVYLDTETTGLKSSDEVLEIAIIDDAGATLLNSLVKPVRNQSWKEAQAIHGISPEHVADAPSLDQLQPLIDEAIKGKCVVIYNCDYDSRFVDLSKAADTQCAMLLFAECAGDWDEYWGGWSWWRLAEAAEAVDHEWTGSAHRALSDAQAARSVWHYACKNIDQARAKRR